MVRKLALSLAIAAAMSVGQANALGLGEIRVNSALNEPLNADIRLVQLRDLSPLQIMPRMADVDEFSLAGITKSRFLNDLKFQVKVEPDGTGSIHVTSSFPVQEPFLSFLMEVNWPNGRLVREYTLLLDPPVFDPAPVTTTITAPATVSTPTAAVAPQVAKPATANIRTNMLGTEVFVNNNDTLYVLAKNNKPASDISIEQMMIAMQRKNPDLFPTSNINVMRAGKVMQIPTAEEARALTRKQAIAEAARQTADWKAGRRAASPKPAEPVKAAVDETSSLSGAAEGSPDVADSQLKIVSAEQSSTGEANISGDEADETTADEAVVDEPTPREAELIKRNEALENRILMTQESVDKVSRENAELGDKLDSIQEQLMAMQRLIELKDQQMSSLQAEMLKQAQEANKPKPSPIDELINMLVTNPLYLGGIGGLLVLLLALYALIRRRRTADYDDAPAPRKSKKAKKPKKESVEEDEIPDFESSPNSPSSSMATPLAATAGASVAAVASTISAREPIGDSLDTNFGNDLDNELDDELANLDLDMDLDMNEGESYASGAEVDEIDSVLDDILDDNSGMPEEDDLDALLDQDGDVDEDLTALTRSEDELLEEEDDDDLDGLEFAISGPDTEEADSDQDAMIDDSFFDEELVPESDQVAASPEVNESDLINESLDSNDAIESAALESVSTDDDLDDLLDDDLDRMLAESAANLEEEEGSDSAVKSNDGLDFELTKNADLDEGTQTDADDEDALEFDLGLLDDDEELIEKSTPPAVSALADSGLGDEVELADTEPREEAELAQAGADDSLTGIQEDAQTASHSDDAKLDSSSLDNDSLEDDPVDLEMSMDTDADSGTDLDEMVRALDESVSMDEPLRAKKPGEIVEEELTANIAHDLDMSLDDEIEELLASDDGDIELIEEGDDLSDADDSFDMLDGADESETKLDLARAYIEMDDTDGARDILSEVVRDGNAQQQAEAQSLLDKMS